MGWGSLDHYLHHNLGMLPLLWCFAHLLILEHPDHHQNLISYSVYYLAPLHNISTQSVHNFLSDVVHRQRNKQTNQRYQNITPFAKEVTIGLRMFHIAPVHLMPQSHCR